MNAVSAPGVQSAKVAAAKAKATSMKSGMRIRMRPR
jgi:hypothetical protein